MRKLAIAIATAFLFAAPAFAQQTVVSGTVKDVNGIAYAGGTIQATLSLPTGAIGAYLNGAQIAGTTPRVTLDATGSFLMQLADNTLIKCANAIGQIVTCAPQTQWTFNVNISPGAPPPLGTGPQTCTATLTITGASQSVSASFSACPSLSNASTGTSPSSIPGLPGVTAVPVRTGLLAEYRFLPGENPCFPIDYSGNGNNGTGCVGTAPTILSGGGLSCTNLGGVTTPASLNSALSLQAQVSSQGNPQAGASFSQIVAGNGNGATGGSISFGVASGGPLVNGGEIDSWSNASGLTEAIEQPNGVFNLALSMGALDHLYVNSIETARYITQVASAGNQTTGVYQICGSVAGSGNPLGTFFGGVIHWLAFYSVVNSQPNVAANSNFMTAVVSNRGVPPSIGSTSFSANDLMLTVGDSITNGLGVSPTFTTLMVVPATFKKFTMSVAANTLAQLMNAAATGIDSQFLVGGGRNILHLWAGTNDCNASVPAPTIIANLSKFARERHLRGWTKVIEGTMLSRGVFDSCKDALNPLIFTQGPSFLDGIAAFATDAQLGADGASNSAVFFQGDHIHPTQTAEDNDLTPIAQGAVGHSIGNVDFQTATTYGSAAAAAVATTALSESTNTVTVTMAATPANCQVGNLAIVTGVTPAGYNSTVANGMGLGGAYILTRSATQITYFDNTTGLGAATVQGTVVCPMQQDSDVDFIVNFGAGNVTLQPCELWAGSFQPVGIQNINAAGSTLVAWSGSAQTITGATGTTLAANSTAFLTAVPNAPSVGGCNWVRSQ